MKRLREDEDSGDVDLYDPHERVVIPPVVIAADPALSQLRTFVT